MKKPLLIAALAVAVSVAAVFFLVLPMTTQWQMKSLLRETGFTQARIEQATKIPGGYNLRGISLDNNDFSTIQNVTLQSGKDGKILTIDKMVLTGDWKTTLVPEIAGWTAPDSLKDFVGTLRKNKIQAVVLQGGQLDVAVPWAGLIRLEAKGQLTLLPDGAIRMQGVLWSVQKQLKAEIQVNGEFALNGLASIDFEVTDGRIGMEPLTASRLGGWLIINKTAESAPWSASAQLVAGTARYYGLALNNVTLSAQGTFNETTVAVQSGGAENQHLALALDAKLNRNGTDSLSATLRADNFTELLQIVTGPEQTQSPLRESRPGAVLIYDTEAENAAQLLDNAKIGLSDLAGRVWLKGIMRKTQTGHDFDLQQAAIEDLAGAFGIDNLESDGLLTGLFALSRNESQIRIDQGLMRSTQPGQIAYGGDALPALLHSPRKDALPLLQSFSYDNLEVYMSGLLGRLEGDISMTGKPAGTDQKPTLITLQIRNQPQ